MRQQQYVDGLITSDNNMLMMACYKDAVAHGLTATSELLSGSINGLYKYIDQYDKALDIKMPPLRRLPHPYQGGRQVLYDRKDLPYLCLENKTRNNRRIVATVPPKALVLGDTGWGMQEQGVNGEIIKPAAMYAR
jgi:hypothetical protein